MAHFVESWTSPRCVAQEAAGEVLEGHIWKGTSLPIGAFVSLASLHAPHTILQGFLSDAHQAED